MTKKNVDIKKVAEQLAKDYMNNGLNVDIKVPYSEVPTKLNSAINNKTSNEIFNIALAIGDSLGVTEEDLNDTEMGRLYNQVKKTLDSNDMSDVRKVLGSNLVYNPLSEVDFPEHKTASRLYIEIPKDSNKPTTVMSDGDSNKLTIKMLQIMVFYILSSYSTEDEAVEAIDGLVQSLLDTRNNLKESSRESDTIEEDK